MRWASPSTTAVLPTPGSPISTGLFLVRRDSTWTTRRISVSRPMTGSILPSRAARGEVDAVLLQRLVGALRVRRGDPRSPPRTVRERRDQRFRGGAGRFSSSPTAPPSAARPASRCSVETYSSPSGRPAARRRSSTLSTAAGQAAARDTVAPLAARQRREQRARPRRGRRPGRRRPRAAAARRCRRPGRAARQQVRRLDRGVAAAAASRRRRRAPPGSRGELVRFHLGDLRVSCVCPVQRVES